MKIYRKIISVSILITIIFTLNVKAEEMKNKALKYIDEQRALFEKIINDY